MGCVAEDIASVVATEEPVVAGLVEDPVVFEQAAAEPPAEPEYVPPAA